MSMLQSIHALYTQIADFSVTNYYFRNYFLNTDSRA